jgi:short-subunit dehydrogenase
MDYRGKTGVITGASSGIGRALALALAGEGMNLVLAATNRERLERVAREVRSLGVRATAALCDVSNQSEVEALAQRSFDEYCQVHLLCNNAGVTTIGPFLEHTATDWAWIYGVVLMGVVHGIQAFYPRMVQQGSGRCGRSQGESAFHRDP